MNQRPSAASESLLQSAAKRTHTLDWERLGFFMPVSHSAPPSCPESPTVLASTGAGMLAMETSTASSNTPPR